MANDFINRQNKFLLSHFHTFTLSGLWRSKDSCGFLMLVKVLNLFVGDKGKRRGDAVVVIIVAMEYIC